jgi:hypothetical protein
MIISRSIRLGMRNVSDKVVEKIKTHICMFSKFFFRKLCRLWDNVESFCRVGQATYDNITWRMCFACWITKDTDTHSEYVILIAFHGNNGYTNAPQYYVIRALPVLFFILGEFFWQPMFQLKISQFKWMNVSFHGFCSRGRSWYSFIAKTSRSILRSKSVKIETHSL